ncbi:MAG TPA: RNA 2',3'-cyclic phosphodiesterase [Planctomycetota bacterium]|nr:RNA 2',3'-cyclic phosphodiesterase [Planctomycetota bacterium]
MRRLFFGFGLPEKVGRRLAEETEKLEGAGAKVRWTPPERMHVTLRFLGETDDLGAAAAARLLAPACRGVSALRLIARGLGAFPEEGPPRVVWVGVAGEDAASEAALHALRDRLDEAARREGFRPEKGGFTPHVTLGRARADEDAGGLLRKKLGPGVRREFAHFRVDEAALFESSEIYGEKTYVPLATARLGARG